MKTLLGIDYGTGGAKACITDDELNVLAYAFREYPIYTDHPGWSEHDPQNYWAVACSMIAECLAKAKVDPGSIAAVAVSSAKPSMVMVDSDGEPIGRAYNLMDRRAVEQVERLSEQLGAEESFRFTGESLSDHPTIINLLWEKENRPEQFSRIHKALDIDGFISMKLTGVCQINLSGGPFYGVAYDLKNSCWDEKILRSVGIDPAILPDLNPCETIIGTVTAKAAKECGLRAGIPVCAGQLDCNAGWLGGGMSQSGDIQMNLGTCGNFGFIHRNYDFPKEMGTFPFTTQGDLISVPTTTTGGQIMRYFRDTFCHLERASAALTGEDVYDLINREAEQAPPGAGGLLVLPYLMGERSPIWDTSARGVIFGLSLHHDKRHIIRAMMEAVAFALYDSFYRVRDEGYVFNEPLVLNEGGAKSRLWRRIISDVFGVPTVLVRNRVGAPYGDALLAGVASGVFSDYSIAAQKTVYIDPIEPDRKMHAMYMEYFALYQKLYTDLKEDFRALQALGRKYRIAKQD